MRIALVAIGVAAITAGAYCRGLDAAPIYLTKDEASFAIQSHALATTGRDINGKRYPLFFQEPGFSVGRDPIYIYATALVLQFREMDEAALRVPTTIAAVLSVLLTVLIAKELFGGHALPALAGVLLMVTPAFFIRSRAALSVILPVPFQLLWLLCLLRYARTGRARELVAATLALGLGVYTYLSMVFFAPVHMAVTLYELGRRRRWSHAAIIVALFAVAMIPLLWWQVTHPGRATEIAASYRMYQPGLTPSEGIRGLLTWESVVTRTAVYWGAFNPSRLFFSGESSLVDSTRLAGIFPLAYLLLLPIGLYHFIAERRSIAAIAVLVTLIVAPVPGALIGEDTIGRYLIVCPLGALVATAGVKRLWTMGRLLPRALAVVAVLSTVVLFRGFYVDYMTDWRARSAMYLGGNLKGAMQHVLQEPLDRAPGLVYLSNRIPYVDIYWEFYRRAAGRDDLSNRVRGLVTTEDDWRTAPSGAVAIVPGGDDPSSSLLTGAGWRIVATITEFYDGEPSFFVLERS